MLSLCHRGGAQGASFFAWPFHQSESQQPKNYMLILVVLSLIKGLSAKVGVELKEQARLAYLFCRPLCVRGRGRRLESSDLKFFSHREGALPLGSDFASFNSKLLE